MPQQAFCVALKLLHISAANLRKLKMWAGSIGAVVEFLPKRPARFGSEDLDVPAWKAHMRIHECRDTVILQLRRGELLGLTWNDVDFANKQVFVTRSVVKQVVGKVKTLASQKAMPLDDQIISDLMAWHGETKYKSADSYVFASGGFASTRNAIWRPTSVGLLRVDLGKNISGLGQFLPQVRSAIALPSTG
jgi:integrase